MGDQTLQVIMLDVRYHRDYPETGGDILGEQQWAWFEAALQVDADLRIVASGSQILLGRDSGSETWARYPKSRQRLFQTIRESGLEREIKKQPLDPVDYRGEHSRPLMDAMRGRLQSDLDVLLEQNRAPKTVEAIRYALGQWEPLMRYLDDPKADIDNNRAEQAIRPTKLGMKNWLFVGPSEPST